MKTKPGYVLLAVLVLLSALGCARTVVQSSGPQGRQLEQTQNRMIYYLPKGVIRVQYKLNEKEQAEMVVETQYVPDPEQCYLLEHTKNYFYKDDVTVSLTSTGLLDKISVTSEARIGSIVMQLVDIAKGVTKLMTPTPGKGIGTQNQKPFDIVIEPQEIRKQEADRKKIKELFDEINKIEIERSDLDQKKSELTKEEQGLKGGRKLSKKDLLRIKEIEKMIREIDAKIKLENAAIDAKKNQIDQYNPIEKLYTECGVQSIDLIPLFKESPHSVGELPVSKSGATESEAPRPSNSESKGIYYRPVLPYKLILKHTDFLLTKVIYLPNYSQPLSIDVNRPGFVDKIQELTFDNGILKEVHIKRPSEAEGFLNIPVSVVKAFAGFPLELIQFKVDHGTVYNQLLQQQIQQLKNERELMELKMKGKNE